MMIERNEKLPRLNYLWIGPPKIATSGSNLLGSDVKDVVAMANYCHNPVCFYCLDEHVEHYNKLFTNLNVNVTVKSVDAYLHEKSHENEELHNQAKKMLAMRKELLQPPRDRMIDRVSFKDAFSLFLLANEGGYTLDTNVKLQDGVTNLAFGNHDHFKMPHKDLTETECWMMYASPTALEEPKAMLNHYLANWDQAQKIIRGNERDVDSIRKFHPAITYLILDSLDEGLKLVPESQQRDPDWEFKLEHAVNAAGKAVPKNLPIVKVYGNTHKPEYECRQIIINDVNEYMKDLSNIRYEERNILLNGLKEKLKDYEVIKNDLLNLNLLNIELNKVLKASKELDKYAQRLSGISSHYRSKSNDQTKEAFAARIDQAIRGAYTSLNNHLHGKKEPIEKIISEFKEKINIIGREATEYQKSKHGVTHSFRKSRFETDTVLDPPENKKRLR